MLFAITVGISSRWTVGCDSGAATARRGGRVGAWVRAGLGGGLTLGSSGRAALLVMKGQGQPARR